MISDISIPRNPIIAKLFRFVRLAENTGFGFDKMIKGWKTYRNNTPEFISNIDHVVVSFSLLEGNEKTGGTKTSGTKTGGTKTGGTELSVRQEEILDLIKQDNKVSYRKISKTLNINLSATQKHVNVLKEKGIIKHIGSPKGGYWEIIQ